MPQFNISELERRHDWQLLVMAVPCPTCGAIVTSPCMEGAFTVPDGAQQDQRRPFIASGRQRVDYHAERKYAAANAWYNRNQEVAGASQQTPTGQEADEPGVAGLPEHARVGDSEGTELHPLPSDGAPEKPPLP